MAVGKNKKLGKKMKGGKKKTVDPFARKEWYDWKAPSMFNVKLFGKTPVTRTTGTKVASEALKGRVVTVSLADLQGGTEEMDYRKIKLIGEEVQGKALLTNFYGMDITRDKLCSLIRKWQTLIEATADVKTVDGFTLRLFAIAFTKRRPNQLRKTSYAQSAQIRAIRKKMVDIMTAEATKSTLKELVMKFNADTISKEIEKAAESIYPLQNVMIRKVKTLKAPKFDLTTLMALHNETAEDAGKAVGTKEAPLVPEMAGAGGRL